MNLLADKTGSNDYSYGIILYTLYRMIHKLKKHRSKVYRPKNYQIFSYLFVLIYFLQICLEFLNIRKEVLYLFLKI